jgi:hypothetical protein
MQKHNRSLFLLVLLIVVIFIAWLAIPEFARWLNHNLNTILTIIAVGVLAFVCVRFVMRKIGTTPRITVDLVLVIASISYLFWIYALPVLPTWVRHNWIYIIIGIYVICAGLITWVLLRRRKSLKNNKSKKKPRKPIPVDIQRKVFTRANNRCQWEHCPKRDYLEIHHIDNNPANNNLNNLICLCPDHHKRAHGKAVRSWQLVDWAQGKY